MSLGLARAFPLRRKRIEKRSLSISAVFGAGLLLAALLSLLYLNQASTVATTGYDIKRLEEEKVQLQIRNEQLRLKAGQLRSLERIEKEAAARLKMGPPEKLIFVIAELPSNARVDSNAASGPSPRPDSPGKSAGNWWQDFLRLPH